MLTKKESETSLWNGEFSRTGPVVRLFRDFFREEPFWSNKPLFPHLPLEKEMALVNYIEPLTDIVESANEIAAKIEMPGIDKENIKIITTKDGIEIQAQKQDEIKEEDKEGIEAAYRNGILELKIPKRKKEETKTKEIKVK